MEKPQINLVVIGKDKIDNRLTDKRMNKQMNRQMDGWMDVDRYIYILIS